MYTTLSWKILLDLSKRLCKKGESCLQQELLWNLWEGYFQWQELHMCTDGHFNNIGTKIGTCRLWNLSTVDIDASFWRIALCRTDDAERFTLQPSESEWQSKFEAYIMEKRQKWIIGLATAWSGGPAPACTCLKGQCFGEFCAARLCHW